MTNRNVRSARFGGRSRWSSPAAVLAAIVAVAPSFAGSFLTRSEAVKTFVKKKEAEKHVPDRRRTARTEFVAARRTCRRRRSCARSPSTVDVGPIFSTTPYDIPGARAVFKTESTVTRTS